jgi:hypothetical protein
MTMLQQLETGQNNAEVPVNENFETVSASAIFGKRHDATLGLVWGYYGGLYNGNTIADGTVTLTDTADNYVVVLRSTGVVSVSTSSTNSSDPLYAKLYKLTCAGGGVTVEVDSRTDSNGLLFSASGTGTVTSVDASGGVQTASGSAITGSGTIRGAAKINAQTGTTYAVADTDRGKHLTLSNASSIAATIAQAGTTGFEDGYYVWIENIGVGSVTLTPTTSTVNGAATLVLNSGMSALLLSDGTNYRAIRIEPSGVTVNAQTGTTYTYLSGDRRKLVTHTNGSAISGTLPQATGAFGANWFMWVENRGAGTLTITPTTSTIDGAASLALTTNQGCLIASDGTNYFTMRGVGGSGSGTSGRHLIYISAGSMAPRVTGGCAALARVGTANGQPDIASLDFDATTQEFAEFAIGMPKSWNEGTVTFQPIWSHAATATNFGVVWQLQGVAVSDGDPIPASFGTAQTSTDTGGSTDYQYVGPESSAITIAGSPAAQDTVFFRVARNPSDGADTLAIDARLMGIRLYITTDADTDA